MNDQQTLATIVTLSRSRPTEKRLVCARCLGEIVLQGGELRCASGHTFTALAELVVG